MSKPIMGVVVPGNGVQSVETMVQKLATAQRLEELHRARTHLCLCALRWRDGGYPRGGAIVDDLKTAIVQLNALTDGTRAE